MVRRVRPRSRSRATGSHALSDDERRLFRSLGVFVGWVALDAIAAVDGVDGLFIGPSDLSASMGHRGSPGHPEVRAAIEDAFRRIRKAGKAPGILAPVEVDARHWLTQGAVVLAVGGDIGLLIKHADELAAKFK